MRNLKSVLLKGWRIYDKDEFYKLIESAGYPVAYLQFPKRQETSFIVYGFPENNDTYADNSRYFKIEVGWLELYSFEPDFAAQAAIEQVFDTNKIPYGKENEAYIDDERLFYCQWYFELIGG